MAFLIFILMSGSVSRVHFKKYLCRCDEFKHKEPVYTKLYPVH